MKRFLMAARFWCEYLPDFFRYAPLSKWHTYFASSWRVVSARLYYVEGLEQRKDLWERQQWRADIGRMMAEIRAAKNPSGID